MLRLGLLADSSRGKKLENRENSRGEGMGGKGKREREEWEGEGEGKVLGKIKKR